MLEVKNIEVLNIEKAVDISQILVTFDIKTNLNFCEDWQIEEKDIVMSQSTMHSMEKFMSGEHLPFTKYVDPRIIEIVKEKYNTWHQAKENNLSKQKVYEAFEQLVHSLPRGFELWATVNSNYLQLKTIVIQRAKHKNQEDWGAFVEACYSMPKFRELCGLTGSEWDLENIFPLYGFYK